MSDRVTQIIPNIDICFPFPNEFFERVAGVRTERCSSNHLSEDWHWNFNGKLEGNVDLDLIMQEDMLCRIWISEDFEASLLLSEIKLAMMK